MLCKTGAFDSVVGCFDDHEDNVLVTQVTFDTKMMKGRNESRRRREIGAVHSQIQTQSCSGLATFDACSDNSEARPCSRPRTPPRSATTPHHHH